MGAYVYCNKPSHIATAVVEDDDGCQLTLDVALFRYAYKPVGRGAWDYTADAENSRLRVASGALACLGAWRRAARSMPILGTFFDAGTLTVYAAGRTDANACFDTRNQCEVLDDDAAERGAKCRVVRWVKLPKGVTEGPMPAPVREVFF
jgi:hypothetical protein